jgi:ectoine hydroxylase-related dioxygenase (phytanoyl-CoA dioxygenase family)
MLLNAAQINYYHSNGYLPRIGVAAPAEAEQYRGRFDELEASEGREKSQIGLLDRHFDHPFIMELATLPNVLDCVEELMGPNILLLATHFFCKYGPDTKYVAWHQDVTYWGLEPSRALTVWYAVDDSDIENGCMRVIPGSHLAGIREHSKAYAAGNLLSVNQEAPVADAEAANAVDLELRAGEASVHDGMTVHCSLPNLSNRRRCGLTLRYVPAYVRPDKIATASKRWKAVLVRGVDDYKHFGIGK